ncbi:MAG: hypothetical protein H7334_09330 [Ferruginibacter sp.]|nr:hypothetical protein [Ferruginibacter sp.]
MIAYNIEWLDNLLLHDELEAASVENDINDEEKRTALKAYPVGFYTPNFFIRIGLAILTIIIVAFSFGLVSLLVLSNANEKTFGTISIFFGVFCYGILELMVQQKSHYHSGVDDALLCMAGICFIGGINLIGNISISTNCLLIFLFAFYLLCRFANALMAIVSVGAFLLLVFFTYIKFGYVAKATAPFLLLLLAAGIYFFAKYLSNKIACRLYKRAFVFVEITALLCGYAAINYFVVNQTANSMFGFTIKARQPLAFAFLFWSLTILLPLVYIFRGVQKKDAVILRVGLILIAAIVFTIRNYYTFLPIEMMLFICGAIMLIVFFGLIRYLEPPKFGFTSAVLANTNNIGNINIEALIIAETFSGTQQPTSNDTNFGGGSFGGGGGTGDF